MWLKDAGWRGSDAFYGFVLRSDGGCPGLPGRLVQLAVDELSRLLAPAVARAPILVRQQSTSNSGTEMARKAAAFVHLRVKSAYSLLEGAVRPKELAELARENAHAGRRGHRRQQSVRRL